jgi:hypothetical protein
MGGPFRLSAEKYRKEVGALPICPHIDQQFLTELAGIHAIFNIINRALNPSFNGKEGKK